MSTSNIRGWPGATLWPGTGARLAGSGSENISSSVSYSVEPDSSLSDLSLSFSVLTETFPSTCRNLYAFNGSLMFASVYVQLRSFLVYTRFG